MNSTIIIALISFAGTLIGTAGGIVASGKLTAFRLEQIETKLDRQSRAVSKIPVIEEKLHNIDRRVLLLEKDNSAFLNYDGN